MNQVKSLILKSGAEPEAAGASDDSAGSVAQLLSDGVNALANLDVKSLESLQGRALAVQAELKQSGREPVWTPAAREEVEACRRIFAEVLRGTGRQLELLRRMSAREKELPWVR
jgi:hypothetical protein